jgi:hypothetical protein
MSSSLALRQAQGEQVEGLTTSGEGFPTCRYNRLVRSCCILAIAVLVSPSTAAADERKPRDSQIEAIAADARAAPPEFAADLLLRLAASSKVIDPEWRRELLEDAYLVAYAAPEPYRRLAVSIPIDTRQSALARSSETALTRVSLQVRAAQLMAFVDPARARELFEWIDLNLESGTCDSPLVPVVDEYYTALAVLARTTFDAGTTGRGDALQFFDLYMWRAHLPTEMPAVARALRRFRPARDEALYLEGTFRLILESGLHDPRGFASVSIDLVSRMMELEDADRGLGIAGWNVTRALRAYLKARLQGTRCADSESDGLAVDAFNAALRRRNVTADAVAPLASADTRPSRMLARTRIDRYWQTPDARRLYDAAVRLRGTGRNPTPIAERRTEEWRNQAERLLVDLEQWTSTREAFERDRFYQKAALYVILADLVPSGALRTRTIRSFVEFLRHTDRDREGRTMWFMFVNQLLELARSADRATVLDALEEPYHPVLTPYARLERLRPTRK